MAILVTIGVAASCGALFRVNPVLIGLAAGMARYMATGGRRRRLVCSALLLLAGGGGYVFVYRDWHQRYHHWYHGSGCNHAINRTLWMTHDAVERRDGRPMPVTTDSNQAIDALMQGNANWEAPWDFHCPVEFYKGPFIYTGAGLALRPNMAMFNPGPLIWICPSQHRGHCHIVRWPQKECINGEEVVEVLAEEVRRGESGEVPYHPDALALMREQLQARQRPLPSPWRAWLTWPYDER